MFNVHVRHYLTPTGLDYFEGWAQRVADMMSKQQGFIDITSERKDDKAYGYVHVIFDTEENLMKWVEHPEHDPFVDELDPYRSQSTWQVFKTTDDDVRDEQITDFIEIPATTVYTN